MHLIIEQFIGRFVGKPSGEDGVVVRAIKELGGIPFCMTNVPQTMKVSVWLCNFTCPVMFVFPVIWLFEPHLWANFQSMGQHQVTRRFIWRGRLPVGKRWVNPRDWHRCRGKPQDSGTFLWDMHPEANHWKDLPTWQKGQCTSE